MGLATGAGYDGTLTPLRDRLALSLFGRGRLVVAGLVVTCVLLVAVVIAGSARPRATSHATAGTVPTIAVSPPSAPVSAGTNSSANTPVTVTPAGSPVQESYDQAFAQGLAAQPGMAGAETLAVPTANIAGGWPALPTTDTPQTWATTFVSGLLDINYGTRSEDDLGPWLQAEESPELIPGIPASVADKVLYISLLDPSLFGGQTSPIPSSSQWQALASTGTFQQVSDLQVQQDPSWAQTAAAGWQPTDVRMTELDVSGLITQTAGTRRTQQHFSVQIIVGTARSHPGYGTVAIAGWEAS